MGFLPTSLLASAQATKLLAPVSAICSTRYPMTPPPRLKAGIFVRALIRRVQVQGASAFVERSGAEEAGAVILKIAKLDGTVLVLNQARNAKGELVWARPMGDFVSEARAT